MANYKAEITLNERDSMLDVLSLEKQMVKTYSTAITEGTSKGFRKIIGENLELTIDDQFSTFMMSCEYDHARVESAEMEVIKKEKHRFENLGKELN